MYPSSSSSSSQHSTGGAASNLLRYGSAPSSLLSAAVDSVLGTGTRVPTMTQCFSVHDSANRNNSSRTTISGCNLQRSYALSSEISAAACGRGYTTAGSNFSSAAAAPAAVSSCTTSAASPPSNLVRHSSSPAGFFNCLASDIGSSVSKGIECYEAQRGVCTKPSRLLSTQLSFTSRECLSQISLVNECVIDGSFTSEKGHKRRSHSQSATSFSISPWDDGNSIVFSAPPSKRPSNNNDSILDDISAMESQFSLPEAAFDMINVENLLKTPRESVPCKIRAKRGCATHPRSIAERERRTRISGKLKKLQELVPNMDKETSYADMLDLAAQHIKGLQSQIEKLNEELDSCTCGCKRMIQ